MISLDVAQVTRANFNLLATALRHRHECKLHMQMLEDVLTSEK